MNNQSNLNENYYTNLRKEGDTIWTPGPAEQTRTLVEVSRFLAAAECLPGASLIEFGCGEAFLAEHLLQRGYRYTGVDLSPSAIDYARKKYRNNRNADFILGDVTDLKNIADNTYDAGLDIMFLHMLVKDDDRRRYLSEVRRVLKPGGHALFIQVVRPDDAVADIVDVSDLTSTPPENTKSGDLPRVPARFKNETGYHDELEQAGFAIGHLFTTDNRCIIHLHSKKAKLYGRTPGK